MNPAERELMKSLDDIVLNASKKELKKIQEIDLKTQLEGSSFYDAYINSVELPHPKLKQNSKNS